MILKINLAVFNYNEKYPPLDTLKDKNDLKKIKNKLRLLENMERLIITKLKK